MKKEELKNAFDAVSPTTAQKEKMFTNIINEGKKPLRKFVYFKNVATVAASIVFVIGIFSVIKLNNVKSPDVPALAISESENPTKESYKPVEASSEGENNFTVPTEDEPSKQNPENATESEEPVVEPIPETDMIFDSVNEETTTVAVNTEQSATETEMPSEEASDDTNVDLSSEPVPDSSFEGESFRGENTFASVPTSAAPTAGNSGGGGGGGAVYKQSSRFMSPEQIQEHEDYTLLFPSYVAEGFSFNSAMLDGDTLKIYWYAEDGKRIKMEITQSYEGTTVSPDDIMNMEEGKVSFALESGEYYTTYQADMGSADELYKMVTSTAYFD